MPGMHRDGDIRYCGAKTVATGQSTVYVNGKLAAVEDDLSTHGGAPLKQVYADHSIFIEGKLAICAAGDEAKSPDAKKHPRLLSSPKGRSIDVLIYGGNAGGAR